MMNNNNYTQSTTFISTNNNNNSSLSLTNRDLIKEYMARTRAPPPIFKPSFIAISPPPSPQYDAIPYTHPALLLNQNDHDDDDDAVEEFLLKFETNREIEIQYIDDNSIELLEAGKNVSKSSSDLKKIDREYKSKIPLQLQRQTAFTTSINSTDNIESNVLSSNVKDEENFTKCKLIGKVNPTLVKTWEQLNRKIIMPTNLQQQQQKQQNRKRSSSSNSSDDRILYPEYGDGNQTNTSTNKVDSNNYHVNVVIHSELSENFYDSIDADDEHFLCNKNDVPSICDGDNEYLTSAAGEVMADDILTEKRKICWSIDSGENRFVYKKDVT